MDKKVPVLLMSDSGAPRKRRWDDSIGFVNLFQGRDNDYPGNPEAYPGDLAVPSAPEGEVGVALQVHWVTRRGHADSELFTLAVNVGQQVVARQLAI